MKFYDRTKELEALRKIEQLSATSAQMTVMTGRRRIGKTTLIKLLLRFYDPTEGEILYNGINIREYNVDSLHKRFATVFQDYKTFALSVNENVLCHEGSEEEKERRGEKDPEDHQRGDGPADGGDALFRPGRGTGGGREEPAALLGYQPDRAER